MPKASTTEHFLAIHRLAFHLSLIKDSRVFAENISRPAIKTIQTFASRDEASE